MTLSTKTKTAITSETVKDMDWYYPDVSATTNETRNTDATSLRLVDVPRTTADVSAVESWQYGDKVYGTHAKKDEFWKRYRRDISKARKYKYKPYYIDTFKPIGKQLKERGRK